MKKLSVGKTLEHATQSSTASAFAVKALLAFVVGFAMFWGTVRVWLGPKYLLPAGSINTPNPAFISVWLMYGLWGAVMAAGASAYIYQRLPGRDWGNWYEANRSRVLLVAAIGAAAVAMLTRLLVIQSAPLTDDESAYLLAARTILGGSLWLPTPEDAEFFNRAFIINDGRMFTQYFIGWPALLSLSIPIKSTALLNPLLFGLSVYPLARILDRHVGGAATLAGIIIFCTSFALIGAASTLLPYTSCLFFLLWFVELCNRTDESRSVAIAVGAALCGSAAFFIRPPAAMAVCAPFVIQLAFRLWSKRRQGGVRPAVAFLAASSIGAALFFYVNHAMYGGAFSTGYGRMYQFEVATGLRFASENYAISGNFDQVISQPLLLLSNLGISILRVSFDIVGSLGPLALLAVFGWRRDAWPHALALAAVLVSYALISDGGIDTFGPVHLIELAGVLVVLLAISVQRAMDWVQALRGATGQVEVQRLCLSIFLGLTLSAWASYFFLRGVNLAAAASNVNAPLKAAAGLPGKSLVFADRPFANQESIRPLRHFVFYIPAGHPGFDEKTLWVNNLGMDRNAAFALAHPDRTAYVLRWDAEGKPQFVRMGEP